MEVSEVAVARERFPVAALSIRSSSHLRLPCRAESRAVYAAFAEAFGWSSPALPECSEIVQPVLARNADAGE